MDAIADTTAVARTPFKARYDNWTVLSTLGLAGASQ